MPEFQFLATLTVIADNKADANALALEEARFTDKALMASTGSRLVLISAACEAEDA